MGFGITNVFFGLSQTDVQVSMHCIVKIVYDEFLCIVMHLLYFTETYKKKKKSVSLEKLE